MVKGVFNWFIEIMIDIDGMIIELYDELYWNIIGDEWDVLI